MLAFSKKPEPHVLTDDIKKKVVEFYNEISRTSPNNKETLLIGDQHTPVKYLEQTLATCFINFKEKFPDLNISQTSFEHFRPKNVKLRGLL